MATTINNAISPLLGIFKEEDKTICFQCGQIVTPRLVENQRGYLVFVCPLCSEPITDRIEMFDSIKKPVDYEEEMTELGMDLNVGSTMHHRVPLFEEKFDDDVDFEDLYAGDPDWEDIGEEYSEEEWEYIQQSAEFAEIMDDIIIDEVATETSEDPIVWRYIKVPSGYIKEELVLESTEKIAIGNLWEEISEASREVILKALRKAEEEQQMLDILESLTDDIKECEPIQQNNFGKELANLIPVELYYRSIGRDGKLDCPLCGGTIFKHEKRCRDCGVKNSWRLSK